MALRSDPVLRQQADVWCSVIPHHQASVSGCPGARLGGNFSETPFSYAASPWYPTHGHLSPRVSGRAPTVSLGLGAAWAMRHLVACDCPQVHWVVIREPFHTVFMKEIVSVLKSCRKTFVYARAAQPHEL